MRIDRWQSEDLGTGELSEEEGAALSGGRLPLRAEGAMEQGCRGESSLVSENHLVGNQGLCPSRQVADSALPCARGRAP